MTIGFSRVNRNFQGLLVNKQVRNAAEEYHAEFAAKEATIAALSAEADAARARMQAEIEKLRREMEARACLRPAKPDAFSNLSCV